MNIRANKLAARQVAASLISLVFFAAGLAQAADKLVGIHSARVMSQSMPWMAQEAGLFKKSGIQTVVCGPGSIEQAHQPDEFVSLEQLAHCAAFMQNLARVTSFAPQKETA